MGGQEAKHKCVLSESQLSWLARERESERACVSALLILSRRTRANWALWYQLFFKRAWSPVRYLAELARESVRWACWVALKLICLFINMLNAVAREIFVCVRCFVYAKCIDSDRKKKRSAKQWQRQRLWM